MGEPSSWGTKELQDAAISKLRQGETAHHTGSLLTVQIPQSSENFDAPTVVKHISGPDARKRFVGAESFDLAVPVDPTSENQINVLLVRRETPGRIWRVSTFA